MPEKRRHPRYALEGMNIYAKTIFATEVEILHFCGSGFLIRSAKRLSMGSKYTFKFEYKEKVISVEGIVMREELTGSKKISEKEVMPIYTATVEFMPGRSDSDEVRQLRNIIADKIRKVDAATPGDVRSESHAPQKTVPLHLKTGELSMSKVGIKLHEAENAILSYLEKCEVIDISMGGIRLAVEQELSIGTIFPLELFSAASEKPILCKGRVAFCLKTPEKIPQQYRVGVEFIDMSAEDKLRLADILMRAG